MLREHGHPSFDFEERIRPKLRQVSGILGAVVSRKFRTSKSIKRNFEIFGLDFMIDRDLRVWLIEANTNPAITTGNSYLDQLIPRMLADAFKLTLDKMFPLPRLDSHFSNLGSPGLSREVLSQYDNTPFKLAGFPDSENLWDRVSREQMDDALLRKVNR